MNLFKKTTLELNYVKENDFSVTIKQNAEVSMYSDCLLHSPKLSYVKEKLFEVRILKTAI